MSYKSRQQSDTITRDCFYQADIDRSGTITIYEFYNFLQIVFQRLGLYRQVNQGECQQLFRFYDDDRNGFLTPNQIVDVVWDLYTADVQNDRVAIQQLLEKIILEKCFNRQYNQFNTSNLYGHWGQNNTRGDWRNYRFNPYQMQKMQKFGYNFQKPVNSFQNVGMSSDFSQGGYQQGGFVVQNQSSLGNFGQGGAGMYGGNNGNFGNGIQVSNGTMGSSVIQVGGNVVVLGGGNISMGGMGMGVGTNGMGMNVNMGGMGNMGGMNMQNSQNYQMGGNMQGFSQGTSFSQGSSMQMGGNGMGMGGMGNQGMMGNGQQRGFHMVNQNSQWGQQQLQMDPFSWQQIPSFSTDPQHIVLPSPSQLQEYQKTIDLNSFSQIANYIQPQQIQLVTPIRGRQLTQMQIWQAVKQLPYMLLNQQGYNGTIHFKVMFAEFVNLLEQNKFKW